MTEAITPDQLPELTDALRRVFGEGLRKVEITIEVDAVVTVRVERYTADLELIKTLYTLVNHGMWLAAPAAGMEE